MAQITFIKGDNGCYYSIYQILKIDKIDRNNFVIYFSDGNTRKIDQFSDEEIMKLFTLFDK